MPEVLVLCYHAVSHDWPATLATSPERLARDLALLVRRGYRGATFHDAVLAPPAPRTLAVTFDDAYRSVLELAFPILRQLGLPATVFVPTDFPGRDGPMAWDGIDQWLGTRYERELRPMSWDQLGTLAQAGWEIGSHTRSHPHLPALSDAALDDELQGSRGECERQLGLPCRTLAYPYGDHDDRVVAAVARAGYSAAGTLPSKLVAGGPLRWPRVGLYHSDGTLTFRLKVSPPVRRLRATPAWERLERTRRALRSR